MRIKFLCLLAVFSMLFTGCGRENETEPAVLNDVTIQTVEEADPQGAVDAIYATLPDARTEPLTYGDISDVLADMSGVVSYYGCVSDVNGGLSDVWILEPAEGQRDTIREALLLYQESKIKMYENYDILDAFAIATEATVYDQGDFVILLMLADNEAARDIIDEYIPL